MDLVQENPMKENREKKLKIVLISLFTTIFLLVIVAIVIYFYTQSVINKQLKVTIDGTTPTELSEKISDTFYIENNQVYTSLRDISQFLGYTFYNGEYKQYSEDKSSGYATNNKELVTFSANSKEIRKYPQLSQSEAQTFEIDEPIIARGDSIFISEKGLERAFNLKIEYVKNNNTIHISTLNYIVGLFEKSNSKISVQDKDLDDSINFNNQKALLSNLVVIKEPDSGLYGVEIVNNGKYESVITGRYASIEFIEGIEDFIVKTTDNKYGIIGKDGVTKVKPDYKAIEEIDKDLGLYLVTSDNNKQGVVNQNGKMIVYQDYDKIGLKDSYGDTRVTNKYLLFNSCIPVMVNSKWGLIDRDGKLIAQPIYDGIGCSITSSKSNSTGCVLIPAFNGIVVEQDTVVNNTVVRKYGIINNKGELLVNVVADQAYITTSENKKTYYLSLQNQEIDIVKYWNDQKNNTTNASSSSSTNTNTNSNTDNQTTNTQVNNQNSTNQSNVVEEKSNNSTNQVENNNANQSQGQSQSQSQNSNTVQQSKSLDTIAKLNRTQLSMMY